MPINTLCRQKRPWFFLLSLAWLCLPVSSFCQYVDTTRVAIADLGDYYEMENGYLGVRIPKATLYNANTPDFVPAPIRCIVYRNGTLSNDFPNYLTSPAPALSMSTTVLLNNVDSSVIKVSYTFDKPALNDGTTEWEPAGPGYYHVTFKMIKGEKVCLVTEESDFEVGYSLKVSDGLSSIDRGRYEGHHSTSIANGYDFNGNQYNKSDQVGWNADVDLSFTQRKEFAKLARWNPWAENTGWHWQLFSSTAPSTANTFGIFHGKPSLLKGAEESGVNLWTEPSSINDLHGACKPNGECHYAWVSENELWYLKIDENGNAGTETLIATDRIRPFVFVEGTTVNILTIDPLANPGDEIVLYKKTGSGAWTEAVLALDATLEDPYVYGASNGTHDFVMIKGSRSGQTGLQLYQAGFNNTNFAFADVLPNAGAFRSSNRPDMRKDPDNNSILVTFAQNNFYQSFNVILVGETTFEIPMPLNNIPYPFTQDFVTFGMSIDPRTGNFFFASNKNQNSQAVTMHFVKMNGTNIENDWSTSNNNWWYIHNHQGNEIPNRRSLATDDSANAFSYVKGYQDVGYFFKFDATSHTWSEVTTPELQAIEPAHIHFNPTTQLFYIVGKRQGILVRYSYNLSNGTLTPVDSFSATARPSAGVSSSHVRLTQRANYFPDIRFQWCIYAGNKNTDLLPQNQNQKIALAQNRLSGLAEKVEGYQNSPAIFSDVFTNGGIYIAPAEVQTVINQLKTDDAFYNQMWRIDPDFKSIMDAWRDPTPTQTTAVYTNIVNFANNLISTMKTGDGIYDFYHLYTPGANEMRRYATRAAGLLADNRLSQSQQDTLIKKAALFARVLWDNDFVPFQDSSGVSLGTASMVTSFGGYRSFFAMLLFDDTEFTARANAVPAKLKETIERNLNGVGASISNPHYLQTSMDVVIFTALQLKNQGILNEFAHNDTLKLFSDFLFFLQTPPSVRFANQRKLICFGDGTEESAAIFGLLGTGFAGTDDLLSQQLMHAYRNGPPRGSDFGPVTIAINHGLPDDEVATFGTGSFPGYLSTFRSGFGTARESATWFLNGDWLSDHRNDDRGGVAMYALGAPLVLQTGNLYNPYTEGGHLKNTVVKESVFPQWNDTGSQPLQLYQNPSYYSSHPQQYFAFKNSGAATAYYDDLGKSFHRDVFQFHPNSTTPIFIIQDSLSDANINYIWSMNFASDGTVSTPSGPLDPPERLWDYQGGPYENPAASATMTMAGGSLHKFEFTGLPWVAHPDGGIDWELYTAPPGSQDANIAEWATTFIPNLEELEYAATNNGASFEERHQILRLRGKEKFFNIIVPFPKGNRPTGLTVTKAGQLVTVDCNAWEFKTNLKYATYHDKTATRDVLTTYTSQALTFADATIEGGAMELEVKTDTIWARLHGPTGDRQVTLPAGNWTPYRLSPNASFDEMTGKWTLSRPMADTLHNSYIGGYQEFIFMKSIKVSPKVFLQGPYSGGLMSDALRSGDYLPTSEPYTEITAFTHQQSGGGETSWQAVLEVTGNNAIVDWVFVELRDKNTPATVLATRAALVQRDGDVVDIDGVSPVDFHGLAADSYFLAIRHRNHLGAMTAAAVALSETTTAVDFTAAATATWGTNARIDLGSSVMGLFAADLNQSGVVDAGDRSAAWNNRNLIGYQLTDTTLNGVTDAGDRSATWNNRNTVEQLP